MIIKSNNNIMVSNRINTSQIYNSIVEGFENIAKRRYFESIGDFKKDMEMSARKEAKDWK